MFSLAGAPPFAGFFGKLMILLALFQSNHQFIALILLVLSVFIPIYYIRLIRFIFFNMNVRKIEQLWRPLTWLQKFIICFFLLITLSFFLFQGPFAQMIYNFTEALLLIF